MQSIGKKVGFSRLSQIIAPDGPIPISKSSWWAGVKSGKYPKPIKLGPRTTVWRCEDIYNLIENPSSEKSHVEEI